MPATDAALRQWARLRQRAGALRRCLSTGIDPRRIGPEVLRGVGLGMDGEHELRFASRVEQSPERLGSALQELLSCSPVAATMAPPLLTQALLAGRRPPLVASLGTHCFTSAFLRRWGLRHAAGPFDWLFSSVPMLAHVLTDDFEIFLDRSHYRPVPIQSRLAGPAANRVQHEFYQREFGVEHVFNHHDAHLDAEHAGFVRRVDRFKRWLALPDSKCLLLTCWYNDSFVHDLPRLHEALSLHGRNFRLCAIAMTGPSGRSLPEVSTLEVEQGWIAMVCHPVSHWGPLEFPAFVDEVGIAQVLLSFSAESGAGPSSTIAA